MKTILESLYQHYVFLLGDPIPPGYSLTISSWQNDADNPRDITIYGLESADVVFFIKFFDKFKYNQRDCFGNELISDELMSAIRKHLEETFAQYPPSSSHIHSDIEEIIKEEYDISFIDDIIGKWNYDSYRVMDDYVIRFISSPIADVTESFSEKFLEVTNVN